MTGRTSWYVFTALARARRLRLALLYGAYSPVYFGYYVHSLTDFEFDFLQILHDGLDDLDLAT